MLDDALRAQLDDLHGRGLLRRLRAVQPAGRLVRIDERHMVNLSSNDYLGLATHPAVVEAVRDAAVTHGVGAGASRLVVGDHDMHRRAEAAVAALKHAPAAVLLPTGYMANLAVFSALVRPGDRVLMDRLCHASLIDAARASGAEVRRYPHLDLTRLETMLERSISPLPSEGAGPGVRALQMPPRTSSPSPSGPSKLPHPNPLPQKGEGTRADAPRTFIVTDSIFSMDGDAADLPALCALARRYDAVLIIDEAHGTGVLGAEGGGLGEAQGVAEEIAARGVTVSTASKALGSLGGMITGSQMLITALVNLARPFVYTTAAPPTQAAAVEAAVGVIRNEPERRRRLLDMAADVRRELESMGWHLPESRGAGEGIVTPIIPLITGSTASATALASHLEQAGLLAIAIRPPTVPPDTARVRLSLRADLENDDLLQLLRAVRAWR